MKSVASYLRITKSVATSIIAAFLVIIFCLKVYASKEIESSLLEIQAAATNNDPIFKKYLFPFPLQADSLIMSLVGSASVRTNGQNFSEALVGIYEIPRTNLCPQDRQIFKTFEEMKIKVPGMRKIASFIIKQPAMVRNSQIPIDVDFLEGIPVSGCLVLLLDGAVLWSGGEFEMSANIKVNFRPYKRNLNPPVILSLGDEFCFERNGGCQLSTLKGERNLSFRNVIPINSAKILYLLFGNISNSAFGNAKNQSALNESWSVEEKYYVQRSCDLRIGVSGPDDYFSMVPLDTTYLFDVVTTGIGQVAIHSNVYEKVNIRLNKGDCIVHLVRMIDGNNTGGLDAESQVSALVKSAIDP